MLKLTNKARALVELNSHASLLVPLALPQRPLPHSVRLDASSPWNVTALLGAALESTTLYTRLKTTDRVNSSSLGNITDLLNVFGKQVIANLEMSVVPGSPEPAPEDRQNGTNGTANGTGALSSISDADHDAYNVYGAHHGNDDDEDRTRDRAVSLDIDLSSPEEVDLGTGASGRRRHRKRHVFSQFLTYRGPENPAFGDGNGQGSRDPLGGYLRRRPKVH